MEGRGNRPAVRVSFALVVTILLVVLAPTTAGAATLTNGDFETGNVTGWTVNNVGPADWRAYSGTTAPLSGLPIPAPPQGSFAAVADQTSVSRTIMYQDVTLEPGVQHSLDFLLAYQNSALAFATPASLDPAAAPNQQLRVDVLRAGTAVDSVASGDVLLQVFRTDVGEPLTMAFTRITANLTPFAGQTVRIRFAVVTSQDFLQAEVDDVRITTTGSCAGKAATIIGTVGNDTLNGTGGRDVVLGLAGNDKIRTGGGRDTVCGGDDNDAVKGVGGNDRLLGQRGNDRLNGGSGRDVCKGGPGRDRISNCE